jgi:hypothetical protein
MAYMKKKTPITQKTANRVANKMAGGAIRGGVGAMVTKTNRTTGAKTTSNKRMTASSAEEFNSNGKMMKTATPRKNSTSSPMRKTATPRKKYPNN